MGLSFGATMNPIQVVGPRALALTTTTTTTAAAMTLEGGKLYKMVPELDIYWDLYGTASAATSEKAVADLPVMVAPPADHVSLSILAISGSGYVKVTEQGG